MIRTFLIPLLAIAGMVFAIMTVVRSATPQPPSLPVVAPPTSPFAAFVAGSGLIESSSQNIAVGTPVAGTVTKVSVVVGDRVKKGDVLFELDRRDLEATLQLREAELRVARQQLERMRNMPRPEEVSPAQARLDTARALLRDLQTQFDMLDRVQDARARSEEEWSRRKFAVETAKSRVIEAEASLSLVKAGAWKEDLAVAQAQVESAQASVDQIKTEIDRRIIRAPIDGKLLQVNVRGGEFAQAGPLSTPLMLMGSVDVLHVRVDVDENDAWRVQRGAKAEAFLRGNRDIRTPLQFVRFEPFVIPKRSLTGDSTERVDTRVLQVLYRFEPGDRPIYVGQQMDVYIEAVPLAPASDAAAPTNPTTN